jgi:hypothetical protein
MLKQSTRNVSCKDSKNVASPIKRLAAAASCMSLTSILANTAASSLVIASAGFGAVYAWTTGSEHGVILGGLFVLMAVSLEIAKPLAVATSLTSFRAWSLVRGGMLAALATVAIAYSLTSELTLMSGARGDLVAERQARLKAGSDAETDLKHARDRYEAAQTELASLPAARPVSELQTQITELLLTPGAEGCSEVNGKVTRTVCPLVTELKVEKARAERRATLQAVVALPVLTKPNEALVKDAEIDVRGGSFGRVQGELATGQHSGTWATFFSVEGIRDDGWRQFSPATIRRGYADVGAKDDKTEVHLNFSAADNFVGATTAAPVQLLDLNWSNSFTSPQVTCQQCREPRQEPAASGRQSLRSGPSERR